MTSIICLIAKRYNIGYRLSCVLFFMRSIFFELYAASIKRSFRGYASFVMHDFFSDFVLVYYYNYGCNCVRSKIAVKLLNNEVWVG